MPDRRVVVVEIMFRYALSRRSFSEDGSPRDSSAKLANSCAITLLIYALWSLAPVVELMPDRRVVVIEIIFRYALSVVALAKTDPLATPRQNSRIAAR